MASFTSVLKKIGIGLLDGSKIATEVMNFPFISQLLGGLSAKVQGVVSTSVTDLNTIAGIISMAEAMFPSIAGSQTGSAKLAAAAPLVQQAILAWAQSSLPGHSKVKDPVKFAAAAAGITSNFADAMNSLGD